MTIDRRQGWLRELKAGDEVFIEQSHGAIGYSTIIGTVEKITPTGRINVNGIQFPATGYIFANYNSKKIKKATPEEKTKILLDKKKKIIANRITSNFAKINLHKLEILDLDEIDVFLKKYCEIRENEK